MGVVLGGVRGVVAVNQGYAGAYEGCIRGGHARPPAASALGSLCQCGTPSFCMVAAMTGSMATTR